MLYNRNAVSKSSSLAQTRGRRAEITHRKEGIKTITRYLYLPHIQSNNIYSYDDDEGFFPHLQGEGKGGETKRKLLNGRYVVLLSETEETPNTIIICIVMFHNAMC